MFKNELVLKVNKKLAINQQNPPIKWFDFMKDKLHKVYPNYDKIKLEEKIKNIWYDQMSTSNKEKVYKEFGRQTFIAKVISKLAKKQPPKEWFDKMVTHILKNNPDYTQEMAQATAGNLWYNELSQYRKDKIEKE